jgi:hypothetical protein
MDDRKVVREYYVGDLYLFTYSFKDVLSSSHYMALNGRIISD